MKIFFAADHAGFEYKNELIPFVEGLGYEINDNGAHVYDEQDDYPEFMSAAAREVAENPEECKAIIIGGSGQGEAIMANRYNRIRAIVYNNENLELITLAREHNDANILSIGARFISLEHAKEAVKLFLETPFSDEPRHIRRIKQISEYS